MKMTDIHAHILPGVDDGSADMRETLQMLRMAVDSGVHTIVATPHCNVSGSWDNYYNAQFQKNYDLLYEQIAANHIPISVLQGMEVHVTEDVPGLLRQKKIITMNHSRYLLVEFDMWESGPWCIKRLEEILDMGYVPIIAHPERYFFIWEQPWMVYEWLEAGCHLQLTKGSILGRFGHQARQISDYLLENDLVACVASDAHSSYQRTTHMEEIYRYLSETFSASYAQLLLEENPSRICQDMVL